MSKIEKKEKKIRKKKSSCWLFYTKSDRGGICRLCQKLIISNNNTTNLLNHLKRKHKIQWEKTHFCSKEKTKEENEETHLQLEVEEDQKDKSIELHRSPLEAHQQGQAYQSSDGRTVIWLHPDVQLDQLSTALQPRITLVKHASFDKGEEAMEVATGDGTSIYDVDQFIQKEEDTMSSDEMVQKADITDEDHSLVLNNGEMIELGDTVTDSNIAQIVTVSSSEDPSTEKNPASSSPSKVLLANLVTSDKSKITLDNIKTSPSKISLDNIKTNPSNILLGNLANTTSLLKKTVVVTRCTASSMKRPVHPKPEWMPIKMGGQTPMSGLVQYKTCIPNNVSLLKSTRHYGGQNSWSNCGEQNSTGKFGEQNNAGKFGEQNNTGKFGEQNSMGKSGEQNNTDKSGAQAQNNTDKSGEQNGTNSCSSCGKKKKSKSCESQREDAFDHFGKYIATLLRNLPSKKSSSRLQIEMVNFVLKEQMLFED